MRNVFGRNGPFLAAIATVAVAWGSWVAPAEAITVSFSTTGCFGTLCTPSVTNGGATLSFTGSGGTVTEPTNTTGGEFSTAGTVSAGTFAGVPFTLTISQTVPGVGAGDIEGTLSGKVTTTSSGASIVFADPSVTILGVKYTVIGGVVPINAPSVNAGLSTLNLAINAVPEPAVLSMTLFGLAGVAVARRRRLTPPV